MTYMQIIFLTALCAVLSAIVISFAINLAHNYSIVDHPGEHKTHEESTPFVGGIGIFLSLCMAFILLFNFYPELNSHWLVLVFCSLLIFATGFVDDLLNLKYKPRLVIQIVVASIVVIFCGLALDDLGDLFFGFPLQLGLLAVPFTVFAIVGGINVINMIDGIDGLSGSVSFVSLLLLGFVAFIGGDFQNLILIVALAGGVIGFLFFNLRYPSQQRARVFLGDNGSMLLGFLIALLLISLAQGANSAMQPVTALWLFAIPLMDTAGVMQRRILMGKSPFSPDQNHLHHILLKVGYRVEEAVLFIVAMQLLLGIIGLAGLYMGVPDFVMLLGFFLIYLGYYFLTMRPLLFIPVLCYIYAKLGIASTASRKALFGVYVNKDAANLTQKVCDELKPSKGFWEVIRSRS